MITLVIPSIPPRATELLRALASVVRQERKPDVMLVGLDHARLGGCRNRQALVNRVTTDLVAFLDDDDELDPHHLRVLEELLHAEDADVVYPWFRVAGGTDPFPHYRAVPWDNAEPHQIPVTVLAKTESLRRAGGFMDWTNGEDDPGTDAEGNRAGEDYRLWCRMSALGMKIVHYPEETWTWYHHASNTSGLPTRW